MDRKAGLIALVLLLAGCGINGQPKPVQPNTLPVPGTGFDVSPEIGTGIGEDSDALYGTSV